MKEKMRSILELIFCVLAMILVLGGPIVGLLIILPNYGIGITIVFAIIYIILINIVCAFLEGGGLNRTKKTIKEGG